ncbi:MAG: hypothetical protein ABIT38_22525 [Gemmatimonadaceae bacterium]
MGFSDVVVSILAGIVVVAFALFLLGLAAIVFARPALADRFFKFFASSARAHCVEQSLRLLIGTSLVVLAPAMWHTNMTRLIAWTIVVSSVGLMHLRPQTPRSGHLT